MLDKNVSVIIPTYNRAHVLMKTIPSYLQDITLEVIIVDDGSEDETREIVKRLHRKYKQVKYIGMKKHRGLPYVKNAGVKKARGKYVFFGDDDACLYQGTLYRLREAIEKFPADIAGANGSYATDMTQILHMDNYISNYFTKPFKERCIVDFNTGKFNFNYKIEHITEGLLAISCFMISTKLAREVEFDVNYIGNAAREDMDYLLQQAEKGRKMVYVPKTYEIDLPHHIVKGGGCHSIKFWKIVLYTIRNHYYFLNKHYKYLKREGYITVSKSMAMLLLLKGIASDLYSLFIEKLRRIWEFVGF